MRILTRKSINPMRYFLGGSMFLIMLWLQQANAVTDSNGSASVLLHTKGANHSLVMEADSLRAATADAVQRLIQGNFSEASTSSKTTISLYMFWTG